MAKITPVLQTTILSLTLYVVSGRSEQFNDCIMAKLGTGTGIRELPRGLATLPQRYIQWSEIGMKDPQEDPPAVHCFCMCSGMYFIFAVLLLLICL